MSDAVIIALIVAVPTTLTALASLIVSMRNGRKIEQVHIATNSKMDQLLSVTGASEKAKGVIEGREQGRGEPR
jgi:uncharacterized membrane protein